MSVNALRGWAEELPAGRWILLHAAAYLALSATALALTWHDGVGGLLFALAWGAPVFALLTAGFGTCLGLLRVLADLPWYWYRAVALLFFAAPLGLMLSAGVSARDVGVAAGVQIIMALLLVQPRRHWATRDPAMDDHRW
ncbi:hypothetical protein [Actinoplanes sp. NPDC026619]|uniref:hypothetical protein n=1 Tax=Actinoplanes sp. NPDC026619 TaxID=3155798 RepID=UPI0033E8C0F0